jgi:sporulation protein YlmC with PRC-barrel domain
MKPKLFIGGLLASSLFATAVAAQVSTTPASPSATATTSTSRSDVSGGTHWRASKLVGVNVYNDQNEKLGDISEVLIDPAGKVAGVVIGVGGFLGIGQRDILVTLDKLKFVNEPMRTSSTSSTTSTAPGPSPGGNAPATRPVERSASDQWYPDHAILPGATKDQLKNMPEFKYS